MKVIEPKTKEEFDATLAAAKGPVIVDFVQKGCGACDPKDLNKLARDCDGTEATVMRLEISKGFGSDVADEFNVQETPTTLSADSGADFKPGTAVEVDPASAAVRSKFKCAR